MNAALPGTSVALQQVDRQSATTKIFGKGTGASALQ